MESIRAYGAPVFATLIYAIIIYCFFRAVDNFDLVSTSFLIGMPIAVGVLMILLAPEDHRTQTSYGIIMPWLPLFGLCAAAILAGWELVICIIMALPILLPVCSLAGVALVMLNRWRARRTKSREYALLYLVVLLPFLVTPIEEVFPQQNDVLNAESHIHINAEAEAVWDQIIAVSAIQPEERPFSYLGLARFPHPVEATLSNEGLGGMRRASYDNGLLLWEPVTVWEPYQQYAFGVQVDDDSPQPFTEIGGAHFDVMEVKFSLEDADDGGMILHLKTRYRLSTRFNFYAQIWTDFLMRDLQHTILEVIKKRAEIPK